jgi:hypothetical protein
MMKNIDIFNSDSVLFSDQNYKDKHNFVDESMQNNEKQQTRNLDKSATNNTIAINNNESKELNSSFIKNNNSTILSNTEGNTNEGNKYNNYNVSCKKKENNLLNKN